MKNRNVLKLALIGTLVGIVVFDIVNIVLYLTEGFCVKIENTGSLIMGYLTSSIFTTVLVLTYFKFKKIEKSEMSIVKKGLLIFALALIILTIFELSIIVQDEIFKSREAGIVLILVYIITTFVSGLVEMIIFANNKGNVKEINKKIREKELE
ncbi:MAG: hypothetical protein E7310_01725 [Clostridiales bacterium]|nr:hypothetical protein [Clostridiales bacterium]